MARIDKATIDRILDATNIVDVVSDFVSLKKRGSSYLGLCPFHNERTPSFSVSASRGIFKCFSCGKAGSAVSFLMDLESMSYTEAIKWLGRKYNIEIKERELTSAEKEADAAREGMYAVNEFALRHFEQTMADTDDGRAIGLSYFRERGISDAMIARFHLGYALDKPDDLYTKALAAGFSEKQLTDTGLAVRTDRGTLYDRFKGRVIYPVHTLSGRVVAFGGRTLRKEKTVAKYVNSPESVIYSKSRELYGMYQARNAIARKKMCILVEGYMDVISMHQAGVENVVASSGTSLTEGQIALIKRFADTVTLIYDSDAAGIKAALRGIDLLLGAGLSLKLVLLPEGDDPDSFAQSHTSVEVEEYIAAHSQDLIGFKTDVLMREAGADPRARTEAINDILRSISIIPDVVEQSLYLDELASKTGVEQGVLAAQLKRFVAKRAEDIYKQRTRREAEDTLAPEMRVEAEEQPAAPAPATSPAPTPAISKALYMAEEDLMRFVLRRGLMYLCDVYPNPEASEAVPMSVVDYIDCELRNSDISFSHPQFRLIWDEALRLRDTSWATDWQARAAELEAARRDTIEAGRADIRAKGADTETIMELEKALLERADKEYDEQADAFASSYIRRCLLRSTDRSLIETVARLASDTVVLSRMYPKIDPREDTLRKLPLVVGALKSVLLKEEMQRLATAMAAESDPARMMELMLRFRELKDMSMQFDKYNGEIVITPPGL